MNKAQQALEAIDALGSKTAAAIQKVTREYGAHNTASAAAALAAEGGGSQPVELVTVDYAFDDGLVSVTEMNPGDMILGGWAQEVTPFNGSDDIYVVNDPDEIDIGYFKVYAGSDILNGLSIPNAVNTAYTLKARLAADADPNDPATSTAGEATLTFAVLRLGGTA